MDGCSAWNRFAISSCRPLNSDAYGYSTSIVVFDWARATSLASSATSKAPATTNHRASRSRVMMRGLRYRRCDWISSLLHSGQCDAVDEATLYEQESEHQRHGDEDGTGHERAIVRARFLVEEVERAERGSRELL